MGNACEEVLSYLTGLAPVGEIVAVEPVVISNDLQIFDAMVRRALRALYAGGYIDIVGRIGSLREIRVLKRLEDVN